MPDPTLSVPVPTQPTGRSFLQTLTLGDRENPLAAASWFTSGHRDGVVQIVDLWVTPDERRRGVGTQMLRALVAQVVAYGQTHNIRPRRLWLTVEQKDQIVSRAFLTKHGFHHTGGHSELYKKQELLIYSKALD